MTAASDAGERRRGLALGLGAYLIWGVVPLFFRLLREVPPVETVAHRVLWSVVLLLAIVAARGGLRDLVALARRPGLIAALTASSALADLRQLAGLHLGGGERPPGAGEPGLFSESAG